MKEFIYTKDQKAGEQMMIYLDIQSELHKGNSVLITEGNRTTLVIGKKDAASC